MEADRHRERETETERQTETDRQIDRQTEERERLYQRGNRQAETDRDVEMGFVRGQRLKRLDEGVLVLQGQVENGSGLESILFILLILLPKWSWRASYL